MDLRHPPLAAVGSARLDTMLNTYTTMRSTRTALHSAVNIAGNTGQLRRNTQDEDVVIATPQGLSLIEVAFQSGSPRFVQRY